MPREALMTVAEVSEYLACSVSMVRRLAQRSEIPYYRLGRLLRFRRTDVDAWLEARHEGGASSHGRRTAAHPDQLFLFEGDSGRA
ncbi:MAG: helix-turn-helix domain-containing protein [Gemmatimonadaceae bacterium]|nr:helix-turn-helix domain-containing protein [Gemmatimonadaceae bacterium]